MSEEVDPGRRIDRRSFGLALAAGLATPACASEPVQRPGPAIAFRRGIGVRSMFRPDLEPGSRTEYIWPPFQDPDHGMSAAELARLVELGFDFVRMPMPPHLLLGNQGARLQDLVDIMHARIEMFQAAGLNVIADLHPTYEDQAFGPERLVDQAPLVRRYLELVGVLARELSRHGHGVALELMNEPPVPSAARWRAMALAMVEAARAEARNLPLVVSAHDGGGYGELAAFQPFSPALGPIVYTYHYYSPGIFTHQTEIDTARYLTGLEWPARQGAAAGHLATARARIDADPDLDEAGRTRALEEMRLSLDGYYSSGHNEARIGEQFGAVGAWADRHGVARAAILLGEFGVVRTHWIYTGAKEESRLAWLRAVRSAAEANGFGWAVWLYRGWGGMALTDRETRVFDLGSARALGLNV